MSASGVDAIEAMPHRARPRPLPGRTPDRPNAVVRGDSPPSFAAAAARLRDELGQACCGREDWPAKVAAAIEAMLALAAAEPTTLRALTVTPFERGLVGALRYRNMVKAYGAQLAAWGGQSDSSALSASGADQLINAVATRVSRAVLTGQEAALPHCTEELIETVLSPYLGSEQARQVALDAGHHFGLRETAPVACDGGEFGQAPRRA